MNRVEGEGGRETHLLHPGEFSTDSTTANSFNINKLSNEGGTSFAVQKLEAQIVILGKMESTNVRT